MKKRLKKGGKAPELTLPDEDGNTVSLSAYWEKGPLIVFFYPQDHTLGCTKEACTFRDGYEDLKEEGAEVFGISADDARSHRRFKEEHRLPFPLLSDEEGKARREFGLGKTLGLLPERVTFVIGKGGTILEVFNSQLQFRQHYRKALEALRRSAL